MKQDILKDLVKEGETLGVRTDSVANLAHMEWQECIDVLCTAISWLEDHIKKECQVLNAKDDFCMELQRAKKNEWEIDLQTCMYSRISCFTSFDPGRQS